MVKYKWNILWRQALTITVTILVVTIAIYLAIGYGYATGYNIGAKQAIAACQMGSPVCRQTDRT